MAESELHCENCGHRLDAADKFCRECGLPTVRRAEAHSQIRGLSPDTGEMQRALDAVPEPLPFLREDPPDLPEPLKAEPPSEPLATSDVVRVTNPTFVSQLASSTALMVVVIAILAIAGVVLLVLALR